MRHVISRQLMFHSEPDNPASAIRCLRRQLPMIPVTFDLLSQLPPNTISNMLCQLPSYKYDFSFSTIKWNHLKLLLLLLHKKCGSSSSSSNIVVVVMRALCIMTPRTFYINKEYQCKEKGCRWLIFVI